MFDLHRSLDLEAQERMVAVPADKVEETIALSSGVEALMSTLGNRLRLTVKK